MADLKKQAEGRQVERRLREKEAVWEWGRRVKGAGKSPRVLVYLQAVRGGWPLVSFAVVLAAGRGIPHEGVGCG